MAATEAKSVNSIITVTAIDNATGRSTLDHRSIPDVGADNDMFSQAHIARTVGGGRR